MSDTQTIHIPKLDNPEIRKAVLEQTTLVIKQQMPDDGAFYVIAASVDSRNHGVTRFMERWRGEGCDPIPFAKMLATFMDQALEEGLEDCPAGICIMSNEAKGLDLVRMIPEHSRRHLDGAKRLVETVQAGIDCGVLE